MDANMKRLRSILQVIALPVTGQMRIVADDCCRMEFLAGTLNVWRRELPADLAATLAPEQKQILVQLERQLARACREPVSPLWTDVAMRQSYGLRRARWLAREALVAFGWVLDLPAQEFLYSAAAYCS